MAWVRIDDSFPDHPKVAEVGPLGMAMQIQALCYANRYLTDGKVPSRIVAGFMPTVQFDPETGERVTWQDIAQRLVDAGIWVEVEGGYLIHDYLEYQRSKADIEAIRTKRAEAGRKGGQAKRKQVAKQSAKQTESKPVSEDEAKSNPKPIPNPIENITHPISRPSGRDLETVLSSVREVIGNLPPTAEAGQLEDRARDALAGLGWDVRQQYPVEDRGDGRRGFVDLLATTPEGWSVALELDRVEPRDKSIEKLRQVPGVRIIVLREGPSWEHPPEGIDAVIGLQERDKYPAEFEEFWAHYPRKLGKRDAFQKWRDCQDARKTGGKPATAMELVAAARNYGLACEQSGTEPRYIMHPKTFLNPKAGRWEDYVNGVPESELAQGGRRHAEQRAGAGGPKGGISTGPDTSSKYAHLYQQSVG